MHGLDQVLPGSTVTFVVLVVPHGFSKSALSNLAEHALLTRDGSILLMS